MDEIERLGAIAAINALKARYYRCLDGKDWPGLKASLAPDLIADFRDATEQRNEDLYFDGRDRFVDGLAPVTGQTVTIHRAYMPEIDVSSPITASAEWGFEDHIWATEGAALPFRWAHGFGRLYETYSRHDGQWSIQTMKLTRIRGEFG